MTRIFLIITILFSIILAPCTTFAQIPSPTANDDDIIKALKQETKKEEEALKIDLESLGLDQLPEVGKATSSTTAPQNPIPPLPTPTVEVKKEEKKEEVKKPPVKKLDPRLIGITTQTPEQEKQGVAEVKLPTSLPITKQDDISIKQDDVSKKSLPSIIAKPIEKIKTLLGPDKKPAEVEKDLSKTSEQSDAKKTAEESDEIKKAKENEIREKIRQRKIAFQKLIEKQKAAKLESLRQKYLIEASGDEVFEGSTDYKTISKIVPKAKIPPKFLSIEDIPPPLLNRIKGEENKHHPMIMSDTERVELVFKTIADNRIDEFNSLYSEIKDPNLRNIPGDTLLTYAILMQRYDAVTSILSKGANPDIKNQLGYTPMNIAIEIMDYKSAKILADMGAKIDYVDGTGQTYLMQAAKCGSLPIVDLLIRKGADVNATDDNGSTPLAFAYQNNKDVVAKYLLEQGARDAVKRSDYLPSKDMQMINDIFEKWR